MKTEFTEYHCEEFFEEYYQNGLFHPTEAQDIFPHNRITFDPENQDMDIGEIWDDHNAVLCYRKGMDGIWGRCNYDRSYQFFSDTLIEFTEEWYQKKASYWRSMTSKTIWTEIAHHYKSKIERHKSRVDELLAFVERCIHHPISDQLYVIAYLNRLGISLKNGFGGLAFENMVFLSFNEKERKYRVLFQLSFFKDHMQKDYRTDQLELMIENIQAWINKGNDQM